MPVHDPIASLRPWPITVTIAGQDYTIPALPASVWLEVLLASRVQVLGVIPGLLGDEDGIELAMRMAEAEVDLDEVYQASLDAIAVAGGRSWWWCLSFAAGMGVAWNTLSGHLILAGVDWDKLSLAGFFDAAYALISRNIPKEKLQLLDLELNSPPAGVEVPFDEDAEAQAFMTMMSEAQGPL